MKKNQNIIDKIHFYKDGKKLVLKKIKSQRQNKKNLNKFQKNKKILANHLNISQI